MNSIRATNSVLEVTKLTQDMECDDEEYKAKFYK